MAKTQRSKKDLFVNGKFFRRCSSCLKFKILNQYGPAKWCLRGKRKTCIPCSNKKQNIAKKLYVKHNPDYRSSNRLRYCYGISILQYELLKAGQNNRCLICNEKKSSRDLFIDHCHKTGDIRGLLCHGCNAGLGFFKENIKIMKSAIKYIEESI